MDRAIPLRAILVLFLPFEVCIVSAPLEAGAQDVGSGRWAEFYAAGFFTRSTPRGGSLDFNNDEIPGTRFEGSTGGGAKVGAFVRPFKYIIGGEAELFAHGGRVTASRTRQGGVTRSTDQHIDAFSLMANLLARYPGDFIQPYVGIGAGLTAITLDGRTQGKGGSYDGSRGTFGLAFQGIVGTRLNVTKHVFIFSEFKYYISSTSGEDECKKDGPCGPPQDVSFAAEYISAGMGVRF